MNASVVKTRTKSNRGILRSRLRSDGFTRTTRTAEIQRLAIDFVDTSREAARQLPAAKQMDVRGRVSDAILQARRRVCLEFIDLPESRERAHRLDAGSLLNHAILHFQRTDPLPPKMVIVVRLRLGLALPKRAAACRTAGRD
jgi:hypothetical protein